MLAAPQDMVDRRVGVGLHQHGKFLQRPWPVPFPFGNGLADALAQRGIFRKALRQVVVADFQGSNMLFEQIPLPPGSFFFQRASGLEHRSTQRSLQILQSFIDHLFPQGLGNRHQARLQGLDLPVDPFRPPLVFLPLDPFRHGHDPIVRLDPAVGAVDRVENGLQAVVLLMADRLELVLVATGALDGNPQQAIHGDLQVPFQHGEAVGTHLVGVAVALAAAVRGVAQKVRRAKQLDHLGGDVAPGHVACQLVPGQLLAHETVVRLVRVERADHVIAVAESQRPVAVGVEVAVGVGVPRRVEPVLAPALTVMRRGQGTLHHALVGAGPLVRQESVDLSGRGGQAGEVKADAPHECGTIRFRPEGEPLPVQRCHDEPVDFRPHSFRLLQRGRRRADQGLKRPMNGRSDREHPAQDQETPYHAHEWFSSESPPAIDSCNFQAQRPDQVLA